MKKIILSSLFLVLSISLMAQFSLTYKNNALINGDVNMYREIQYVDPGNAGPNQIWDFSKIQYTGKNVESSLSEAGSANAPGTVDFNLVLDDSGYEYFFNYKENQYEEMAVFIKANELMLIYSDPVMKMKYPFLYGDRFTDQYSGAAFNKGVSQVDVSGDYSVIADAYGTMILPDRVIKNVLRVKITRNGIDRNMCSSTVSNSERYAWYAPGMRYPVLNVSTMEYQATGQVPTVTKTAFINLDQMDAGKALTGTDEPQSQIENSEVSVILFPNPFTETLGYNYFLRKQLPVTIELFDMTGKSKLQIVKNQVQSEGLHSGELDGISAGLLPGIYYLRFTFDKQVVISKIVKI